MNNCYHKKTSKGEAYCTHSETRWVDPNNYRIILGHDDPCSWSCNWCTKFDKSCEDLNYGVGCNCCNPVIGHWDDDMNWIEVPVEE